MFIVKNITRLHTRNKPVDKCVRCVCDVVPYAYNGVPPLTSETNHVREVHYCAVNAKEYHQTTRDVDPPLIILLSFT